MAVQRRVNWVSQQRVDTPDMRSIESAASNDFDALMQTLYLGSGEGYIFRGFDILMAGLVGGAASGAQMNVDQAAILHSKSSQSGTFLVVRPGTPPQVLNSATNTNVQGAFSPSSLNYVGIEYVRFIDDTTASQVYIWDPTINDETTKVIPRAQILKYNIIISTGSWAANVLPVCTITTDAGNNVLSIEDNRRLMMRLGTAGRTTPNPFYSYPWTAQAEGRTESPFISSSNATNPFHGGDKMLGTEKDWKDAIMSVIKEIKGSAFWYSAGSSSVSGVNLTDIFFDAVSNVLTMRGKFIHSKVTPGNLTWTGDLHIDSIIGPLFYNIPANTVTLNDKQVAYVTLVRNNLFQPTNTFTFVNGSTTITASSLVAGIFAGDWIKFFSDDVAKWAQVQSVIGNTVTLLAPYQGTTGSGLALKATGSYTMQVADPLNVPASSDTFWIAKRDDNGTITAVISAAPTGASRVSGVTTFTTTAPHGINAGQNVAVAGVTDTTFNGLFEVISTPSPTTFTVTNTGADGTSGSGTVNSTATIYLRGIGEITQGSSSSDDSGTIEAILQYIGSAYAGDTQPQYSSTNYVTQGIDLTSAIGQLDAQAGTGTLITEQDRNLKLILGGVWANAAGVPAYTLVAQNAGQNNRISVDASTERVAQQFTPSASGNLGKVTLYPRKVGTASGTFVIEIRADSAGSPGSLLATSAPINIATLPTTFPAPAMDITFSSPPAVVNGTPYWIVENPAGATVSGGNTLDLNDNSGSPNLFFSSNSGVSYAVQAGLALEYQAYTVVGGSGAVLSWTADANIQIPGLANSVNRIVAGSATFTAADQVAYVEVNRSGAGGTLAVTVAANASLVPTNNTTIFARFLSDGSIIVGSHSFRLIGGESKELDAGMSIQNRTLIGILDEANGSANWNTILSAPLRTIPTDNTSIVGAVASMDTEIDKFFGQMRIKALAVPNTRVNVTPSDVTMLTGELRSQKISSLLLSFDGAQIDFATGNVYESDGTTPLGVNFTPVTIAANQFQWYSISVIPQNSTSDGKLAGQLLILPGNGTGASAALAQKAPFPSNGIPLGEVYVQENGAGNAILAITEANVVQLGIGSGSGGGSGDTTDFLTRMEIWHDGAPYEFLTTAVFETDIDTQTSVSSVPFDYATNSYKLGVGQSWTSTQRLDPEFLAEALDIVKVEAVLIYNGGFTDPAPTFELSRDGGANYQSFPVQRTSPSSDSWRGELIIADEPTQSTVSTYASGNADSSVELDASTNQQRSQPYVLAATQVVERITSYVNKIGSPAGNLFLRLVKDDGTGKPSTAIADILMESSPISAGGIASGISAVVANVPTTVLAAGTYHLVYVSDLAYKNSFSTGVTSLGIRQNSAGPSPYATSFDGTAWTIDTGTKLTYLIEGRILDLRVRVTSSIANAQLAAVGVLYNNQQSSLGGVKNREVFAFDGGTNPNTFTLTTFLPDPDLLMVFEVKTGQVYVNGSGGMTISGQNLVFPANTFNKPGESVTLVAVQPLGNSFDNSDRNIALLAANHLGSTDPGIDQSVNGNGIFLRRPDGTLREIAIDNNDNIVIYSV